MVRELTVRLMRDAPPWLVFGLVLWALVSRLKRSRTESLWPTGITGDFRAFSRGSCCRRLHNPQGQLAAPDGCGPVIPRCHNSVLGVLFRGCHHTVAKPLILFTLTGC